MRDLIEVTSNKEVRDEGEDEFPVEISFLGLEWIGRFSDEAKRVSEGTRLVEMSRGGLFDKLK